MGVYIKGMEMPKSCYKCAFMYHERRQPEVWCTANEKNWIDIRNVLSNDRHERCPIVPVPPHGRLGDLDALMGRIEHDTPLSSTFEKIVRRYIENAPTAIPAEEGE